MLFSENPYDTLLPMTSPNWYDQEPYIYYDRSYFTVPDAQGLKLYRHHNIPLIIEKAKEGEKTKVFKGEDVPCCSVRFYECQACGGDNVHSGDNFCPHCGREIDWS